MWRKLISAAVILAVCGQSQAQSLPLVEAPLPKSCFRNELTMELTGKVAVQQEGKAITLNQKASARHQFIERILEAKDGLAEKSARIYEAAEATITIDSDTVKRSFRPDRRLIIAQRGREQLLVYCPWGPFTEEEKELTEHFDTLALPGLLPGKDTSVGAGWTIPTNVTLSLCDLEGVVSGTLTGKLAAIQGQTASGSVEGIVKGIAMGAQVTMEIKARFAFDVKEKRIIAVEWQQHEERMQGPINPAAAADVTYKLTRIPVIEPNELGDIALVRALSTPVDKASNLVYRDPKGRFEFQYGRNWHLVGHEDKHVVLRLLSERGDFIAQATFTPYTKETPGKMMEIDDFVHLMAEAPGWEQDDQLLEKNASVDVAAERSLKIFRVGAGGKLGGVPAIQYFHLLTGIAGDQMIITFTMDPKQAPNLSPHDLALIRSISFPQAELTAKE
jgi:hypothetical protein